VLDQEVRVAGEEVRPAEGVVVSACLVADEPLVVTVAGRGSHLIVTPSTPALGEFARHAEPYRSVLGDTLLELLSD
jgi:hypothetical protein